MPSFITISMLSRSWNRYLRDLRRYVASHEMGVTVTELARRLGYDPVNLATATDEQIVDHLAGLLPRDRLARVWSLLGNRLGELLPRAQLAQVWRLVMGEAPTPPNRFTRGN